MEFDAQKFLRELPKAIISDSMQELGPHQYQITDSPLPLPENDDDPVLSFEIMSKVPTLKVLMTTSYNPDDYSPLGSEEEERDVFDNTLEALACGDGRLLIQREELDSWEWFQHAPEILRGENPDWRIIGMKMDTSGMDFVIMRNTPLPNGQTELHSFTVNPDLEYGVTVETADGAMHTYLQNRTLPCKQFIWSKLPDGMYEIRLLYPSKVNHFQTCVQLYTAK